MAYSELILARSPVGYWRLNESSGAGIADSSGNGLTGTLSGSGYTQNAAGIPGGDTDGALQGSSDVAIHVGDVAALDITGAITIEAWVKHTTSSFSGSILFKASTIFSGLANTITYDLGFLTGTLHFQISNGSTSFSINVSFTGYAANTWHLITATWDGTTGANGMKIMIDGAVAVQGTSTISAIRTNSDPLKIAGKSGSANAYEHFPGVIDEVVLINGVTSLATHQAIYTAGKNPVITAGQGSFALTGQAAQINVNRVVTAEAGAFTLTGQDADIFKGTTIEAGQGSFALTGQDAAINVLRLLLAEAGTFTLTGQDADIVVDAITRYRFALLASLVVREILNSSLQSSVSVGSPLEAEPLQASVDVLKGEGTVALVDVISEVLDAAR